MDEDERVDIDALYDGFCDQLPGDVRSAGKTLACDLGLVPKPDIAWSDVFKHEVTLQAPVFFAEGMPGVERPLLEAAVLAHMLSVIEAFGSDRIADRQAEDTPELRRLLSLMRDARDDALAATAGSALREIARRADRRTRDAISSERVALLCGAAVSLEKYSEISAGKQAVGIPGSLALARAAGWATHAIECLESTLMGVWLGLQFQDDVADWEEDFARGGAWAVLIARRSLSVDANDLASLRRLVLSSGAQVEMLELAHQHLFDAARGADALGALRLGRWARDCAAEAREQAEGERRSPGYFSRARKLGAWKAEVLT
jgi:hypothetical protein